MQVRPVQVLVKPVQVQVRTVQVQVRHSDLAHRDQVAIATVAMAVVSGLCMLQAMRQLHSWERCQCCARLSSSVLGLFLPIPVKPPFCNNLFSLTVGSPSKPLCVSTLWVLGHRESSPKLLEM